MKNEHSFLIKNILYMTWKVGGVRRRKVLMVIGTLMPDRKRVSEREREREKGDAGRERGHPPDFSE
jgi:hypothetical protein